MNLTAHFTLEEFERTGSALPNKASVEAAMRLRCLCAAVLEPWRERVGPLRVTSGFRSAAVNEDLRRRGYSASSTSQHMLGEAADVVPVRVPLVDAWTALLALAQVLPVDQAIVYQRPVGEGWVHASHTTLRAPRRELLVQPAGRPGVYVPWSSWTGPLVLP